LCATYYDEKSEDTLVWSPRHQQEEVQDQTLPGLDVRGQEGVLRCASRTRSRISSRARSTRWSRMRREPGASIWGSSMNQERTISTQRLTLL